MPEKIWHTATKTIHNRFSEYRFSLFEWVNTNTQSSPKLHLNTFQEKIEPSLSIQCLSITLYYWGTHPYSMFVHGCSRSRRLKSLEHSISKLEKKVIHAITCLRSRLAQLASFKGGASLFGSSRNASSVERLRRLKWRCVTSGVWPLFRSSPLTESPEHVFPAYPIDGIDNR